MKLTTKALQSNDIKRLSFNLKIMKFQKKEFKIDLNFNLLHSNKVLLKSSNTYESTNHNFAALSGIYLIKFIGR